MEITNKSCTFALAFKKQYMVDVVQLVRASDCGSECRGFESHLPPQQNRGIFNTKVPLFALYTMVYEDLRK